MRSIFFSTDLFLRLTDRIGGTLPNRCCWSWDKILPSFVSDKGGLRPWAPLRVSIPTNSSKREEGSRLQCLESRKGGYISNHRSSIWSLITISHWSHNDHSERLCAVGAAGGQGEVSTNRARRQYVAWIERDDKADSPPSQIFCWRMLVAGGS